MRLGEQASERRVYRCRFVRAGRITAPGGEPGRIEITAEALRTAAGLGLFDYRAVFVDHAGCDYPSLHNLVGVTGTAAWNPETCSVEGDIRLYDTPLGRAMAVLLDEILLEGEHSPDVGLSMVFFPIWDTGQGSGLRRIKALRYVESVDLVFQPAADGRVLSALQAGRQHQENQPQPDSPTGAAQQLTHQNGGTHMTQPVETPELTPSQPEDASGEEWLQALSAAAAEGIIQASGLPQASRERLAAGQYDTPEQVHAAIEAERRYLARLAEDQVVQVGGVAPRSPHISLGLSGFEQFRQALEALVAGERPPQGVRPLTGIREAYMLLSGDYELTGRFYPERVSFASVDSSTMAGLVADALNKRVASLFQQYPRWWEKFVTIEDFTNLQQVKWITLGGVGELPTVAEGAAYTEMSWDDQTETTDFVKKGGYLGITLESIDKDDTRRLQAAPRALAQAAWLSLAKSIAGIFTAGGGVGPAMSDGKSLFHADHGNLGSAPLSTAAFAAARSAMRKQTELNSQEPLGALTAPRYLLVPPDLEVSALQVLASEYDYGYAQPEGTAAPANVLNDGGDLQARLALARERVIVVDLWSEPTHWALVADPNLYPTIGLGFRYGRAPELFSVASPTSGLMFTHDTMPIKARFFYAVGPITWRGLYKSNPV